MNVQSGSPTRTRLASAVGSLTSSPVSKSRKLSSSLDQDNDDLYGDLEDIGLSNELARVQAQLDGSQKRAADLETELEELKRQLDSVLADNKRLEENCCVIYNTAMRELGRKDKEIERLKGGLRP
jgi:archaellum component FlaC